jgi:hypothetical protein
MLYIPGGGRTGTVMRPAPLLPGRDPNVRRGLPAACASSACGHPLDERAALTRSPSSMGSTLAIYSKLRCEKIDGFDLPAIAWSPP